MSRSATAKKPRPANNVVPLVRAEHARSVLTNSNTLQFGYRSVEEAFPNVDPGHAPLGAKALFQIRHPKTVTAGGLFLTSADRSTEYYNTQVAKVIALGPLCFKQSVADPQTNQPSLSEYPEGPWFKPGDFVRVPKYGGDRFAVPFDSVTYAKDEKTGKEVEEAFKDEAIFCFFRASDIISVITGNPLALKAFYD